MKAADLKDRQKLTSVKGGKLKVIVNDGKLLVGGNKVAAAAITKTNGVIHAIDKVFLPKD
jgi:uncharacterized surface protein with fasciclin (FAS1) repeats